MFLKSNKMLFQKIFRNFERKNNRLLVYTMSLYSLLAILSISSSITLLSSYSQQQEEYSLIREWGSKGFDHGQFSARRCSNRFKSNVFVTDITAGSNAVQKFDQNGTFISSWGQLVMVKVILSVLRI